MNDQIKSVLTLLKTQTAGGPTLHSCDLTFYRNKISWILHPSPHSIFRTRNKEKQIPLQLPFLRLYLPYYGRAGFSSGCRFCWSFKSCRLWSPVQCSAVHQPAAFCPGLASVRGPTSTKDWLLAGRGCNRKQVVARR